MKRVASGVSLAIIGFLAAEGAGDRVSAQNAAARALVIQGGTLIDGNGGAPVPNSVVVVQGNRITAVGRAAQVQAPRRRAHHQCDRQICPARACGTRR